jgi:hypothetical protein
LSLRVIQDVRLCTRSSAGFQSCDARVNALSVGSAFGTAADGADAIIPLWVLSTRQAVPARVLSLKGSLLPLVGLLDFKTPASVLVTSQGRGVVDVLALWTLITRNRR